MKHIYIIVAACYIIHQSCSDHIMMGERGSYKGIWVGFSRRIKSDDKKQLLQDLKSIFSEASKVLYQITEQRAYFKEITFIIPQSWGEEENWINVDENNVSKVGLERLNEADIFIEAENGFFGKVPYTIQAGGCEQQGLGIHIPETFLQQQSKLSQQEKARILVYQWLKYRYGVFDEHGFHGDDRYPVLHGIPGNSEITKVTSCSNHDVKYRHFDGSDRRCLINKSTGRLNDATCPVYIIEDNPPDQSSSFMFSPKMSKLCGSGGQYPHNVSSPTKHNTLCFERSISDVVLTHKDLKENHGVILQNTTFHYVQESKLRLLLAVDRTEDTSEFKLHNRLQKAISVFLNLSLPRDHVVKLLFYDSNNETVTATFEEGWSFPGTDDTRPGCILCAIRDSLAMLEEYEPMDGSIFLLIAKRILHNNEITLLSEMATMKKIRVNVVFCLTDEASVSQMAERVAGTGIKIQNIPLKENSFLYLLYNALQSSLRDDTFGMMDDNILIMQKYFGNPGNYANFTFPVDKTAKRDIRILLSTVNRRYIFNDRSSMFLTTELERNRDYKFFDNYESDLKIMKILKEVNGDISVSISKKADVPLEAIVVAKESNNVPGIIVRSWMHPTEQFIMVNSDANPVILYTEVRSGNFPVQNANVQADLYHQNINVRNFSLVDDGNGDPDITKGDGIYSSYMTGFPAGGDYFLQISVDDADGKAVVVSKTGRDNTCCGSFIPAEESIATESFHRLYTYGSFFVSIPQDQKKDVYPPSRITDLMVTDVFNKSSNTSEDIIYVTFSFSAAGGDYNHGQAFKYELSYSNYRMEVKSFKKETIAGVIDAVMPQGKKYGEKAEFKFEVPADKLKLYRSKNIKVVCFAVRAVDRDNNVGQTSNIVEVQLPPPPPPPINPFLTSTLGPDQEGSNNESIQLKGKDNQPNSAQIGMIVGIAVGIVGLIILVVLVALFLLSRGKKARKLKDSSGSLENNKVSKEYLSDDTSDIPTKLSNPISPIQSWPADVLLDHYDKVQEAKNKKSSSDNSLNSSSSDCTCPLKPNPVYENFSKDSYNGDNSCLPSAPYSSSQSSLSQAPRSVTQV